MEGKGAHTIDEYIQMFPKDVQKKLESIRKLVRELAPEAQEKISYQMPTFYLNGNLVHFAAFKNHIGFYPTPSGIGAFQKELSKYKNGKGSVQFPMEEALPIELIKRMVKYRLEKNRGKSICSKKERVSAMPWEDVTVSEQRQNFIRDYVEAATAGASWPSASTYLGRLPTSGSTASNVTVLKVWKSKVADPEAVLGKRIKESLKIWWPCERRDLPEVQRSYWTS